MTKTIAFFLLLLFLALPARADDAAPSFIKPTFEGMLQTMLRLDALTLDNDGVADDYAIVTECKLYKAFYSDDFKWNKVRTAIRDSAAKSKDTFPVAYYYGAQLQLDRYDFDQKLFRFTDKSAIRNVNAFGLYHAETGLCPNVTTKHIPLLYRAVIDAPISMAGIPLDKDAAQALLLRMKIDNNTDRVVYVHFNMRIVYIEKLHSQYKNNNEFYAQTGSSRDDHAARFDARLDSIDFYEDEAATKLIYSYKS